eukprot:GHVU01117691.1.p2 GENE.GHVU01117691.1~~GHVU01117691.1.p2  ORF type:complete len:103 (+),score=5.15 GHVU01117691.1:24-311(+)
MAAPAALSPGSVEHVSARRRAQFPRFPVVADCAPRCRPHLYISRKGAHTSRSKLSREHICRGESSPPTHHSCDLVFGMRGVCSPGSCSSSLNRGG